MSLVSVDRQTGEIQDTPNCDGCRDRDSLLADRELRHKRELNALKAQMAQGYENEPEAEDIREVLEHWRYLCRGPKSRCDISLDGDRAKAVRRLLKVRENGEQVWPVGRLKRVVDGAKIRPFVGPRGFSETRYPGSKRHNDAAYVFRDAAIAERYEAWALAQDLTSRQARVLGIGVPDTCTRAIDSLLDVMLMLDRAGVPKTVGQGEGLRSLSVADRVRSVLVAGRPGLVFDPMKDQAA